MNSSSFATSVPPLTSAAGSSAGRPGSWRRGHSAASPGVRMSREANWIWKADTPCSVPRGARISAGKSGSVARSLPRTAVALVKRSPVTCIPSPESPAKRTTTRSRSSTVFANCRSFPVAEGPTSTLAVSTAGQTSLEPFRHRGEALLMRRRRRRLVAVALGRHALGFSLSRIGGIGLRSLLQLLLESSDALGPRRQARMRKISLLPERVRGLAELGVRLAELALPLELPASSFAWVAASPARSFACTAAAPAMSFACSAPAFSLSMNPIEPPSRPFACEVILAVP